MLNPSVAVIPQLRMNAKNPYRIFFPLGWFLGLAGVSIWILMFSQIIVSYPKEIHADIMMGGFLIFFVAGFLLTALPWFTGTKGLDTPESLFLGISVAGIFATVFLQNRLPYHAALLIHLVLLFIFCLRRVRHQRAPTPPPLIFVFAGLGGGILSLATFSKSMSQLFFYQGFLLSFVLGVGIFLVPNLLGHGGCTQPIPLAIGTPRMTFLRSIPKLLWIVMTLFFLSFYIQTSLSERTGLTIRAALLTLVSFHDWKIYRLPTVRSALSIGLWLSCWLLLGGLWLQVVNPSYDIHARHLTYIGGFGLTTLMIATRVTLSHGGHDMTLESRSKRLQGAIVMILLAALTRVLARWLPEPYYWNHLDYASWLWVIGLLLWGSLCFPRWIRLQQDTY